MLNSGTYELVVDKRVEGYGNTKSDCPPDEYSNRIEMHSDLTCVRAEPEECGQPASYIGSSRCPAGDQLLLETRLQSKKSLVRNFGQWTCSVVLVVGSCSLYCDRRVGFLINTTQLSVVLG